MIVNLFVNNELYNNQCILTTMTNLPNLIRNTCMFFFYIYSRKQRRIMRLRKGKYLVFGSVIALLCFGILTSIFPMTINLRDPREVDLQKCPACFGEKLCPEFLKGSIVLTNWTRYRLTKLFNVKNVYYGQYFGRPVVLKKLAHDDELEVFDREVCRTAASQSITSPDCNKVAQNMRWISAKFTLYTNRDPKTTFPHSIIKTHVGISRAGINAYCF